MIELRGQKVLLDRDVATLYGVETKRVNEAVKNNAERFPNGYVFVLKPSEKQYVVENFDHIKMLKKSPVEPRAFTEKGLYMLATILKSPRAVETTLAIIESFAHLRELARNVDTLLSIEAPPNVEQRQSLIKRSSHILSDLLTVADDEDITETEASIEVNLYAIKMKRTVKKTKKK
jgi:phage regulator Rha-like protein